MPINLPTIKLFVFINGSFVNNKDFIYLFIAQFSPFLGPCRLLPIYIGKIPIRGKNLSISF